MSDAPTPKDGTIPKPPSPEELREVSEQQALITDEWAPAPKPEAPAKG